MPRYFFRIDDVAPNMHWENFNYLVAVFKKHGIKPLLAVIPDSRDPELLKYTFSPHFWQIINQLRHEGWMVAQHGFEHLYKTKNGGILGLNSKGEFAGLDFETQKEMISAGKRIFKDKIIEPEIFVAPAHSFDKNTALALYESGFKYLSDGIALYPFKKWNLIWLPQVFWKPKKMPFGLITIALHPNTMTRKDLDDLQKFIEESQKHLGDFSELMNWERGLGAPFIFVTNQIFKAVWRLLFLMKHGLSR